MSLSRELRAVAMPTLTVDGTAYEVAEGRTILQALDDLGLLLTKVDIPHYCWHPKLPIDGSCRLCQVEIEGVPKLQIACNTPVQDGMAIRTVGDRVKTAQRSVMELLLLNHPLDCPICDQAGECKLQDFAVDYGLEHARTNEPRRPAKKGVDLGPTIVLDQERCILCRRCVRFCREIPKTGELGVFSRGDRSLLDAFPGTELDNDYSMNVADICPVGALTTRDFRFRIRVWFLEDLETVCNQCSNGCNLYASTAHNKVYRYLPRRNDDVNDTWICDHGRLSYRAIREGRLSEARVGGRTAVYGEAVRRAGELLAEARVSGGRIVGVASPFAANEDLYLLRRLLDAIGGDGVVAVPRGDSDDLLIKEEKAPNANGARLLGFEEASGSIGASSLALILGHTLPPAAFGEVDKIILIDTHSSPLSDSAEVLLPARSFAEKAGTFTNHARRVQRFLPVVEPVFECGSEGEILQRIAEAAGIDGFAVSYDPFEISKRMADEMPAFGGAHLETLDDQGRELP
jgi:NADH-quinone oxidoreductase subunit G